jgi:hypothetical protein
MSLNLCATNAAMRNSQSAALQLLRNRTVTAPINHHSSQLKSQFPLSSAAFNCRINAIKQCRLMSLLSRCNNAAFNQHHCPIPAQYQPLNIQYQRFISSTNASQESKLDNQSSTTTSNDKQSQQDNNKTNEPENQADKPTLFQNALAIFTAFLCGYCCYTGYKLFTDWPPICQIVMDAAAKDPLIRSQVLGDDTNAKLKRSRFWSGTVKPHDCFLVMPLSGPKGKCTVHARGLYDSQRQRWTLVMFQASIGDKLAQRHTLRIPPELRLNTPQTTMTPQQQQAMYQAMQRMHAKQSIEALANGAAASNVNTSSPADKQSTTPSNDSDSSAASAVLAPIVAPVVIAAASAATAAAAEGAIKGNQDAKSKQ